MSPTKLNQSPSQKYGLYRSGNLSCIRVSTDTAAPVNFEEANPKPVPPGESDESSSRMEDVPELCRSIRGAEGRFSEKKDGSVKGLLICHRCCELAWLVSCERCSLKWTVRGH